MLDWVEINFERGVIQIFKVLRRFHEIIMRHCTGIKGCLSLFHHSIDMRTDVNLSISCRKNMFLLENFNKNKFFLHEMDKLTSVLMSIE